MTPNNQNNMANPRRNSISTNYQTPISNPDTNSQFQTLNSLKLFLKKPHSFPFLLSIFLFLTWVFLRLQRPPPPPSPHLSAPSYTGAARKWSGGNDDDRSANLARYSGLGFPSPIAKDNRGWMIDPISFAYKAGLSGGALTCASLHIGEIRPAGLRGNHRHHICNETFLISGAKTVFRLENKRQWTGLCRSNNRCR